MVAAAVILPEKFRHRKLKDSKQLLPELRQEIYDELVSRDDIIWSIGVVDSFEIDQINILRATHKAMRFALEGLCGPPDHVLIDGLPVSPFPLPQTAIIDGDCISLSIAAASVIAKVTRDRLMREFCARFPSIVSASTKVTAPNFTSSNFMNTGLVRSIADLSSRWRNRFSRSN